MKLITSLSIERNSIDTSDFWPKAMDRLVVLVWESDPRHDLVAIGIDPEHGRILVEADVPRAALSAFLEAVIEGRRDIDHRCKIGTHHAAATGPWQLVRKTSLALARTIRADERLAQAVVTPSPPAPPRRPPSKYDEAPIES
jgi:hypothetical protein